MQCFCLTGTKAFLQNKGSHPTQKRTQICFPCIYFLATSQRICLYLDFPGYQIPHQNHNYKTSLDLQPFQRESQGYLLSDLSACARQLTAPRHACKDPRSLTQIYSCNSIQRKRTLGGGELPHHRSRPAFTSNVSQAGVIKTQHTLRCFSSNK